MSVVRGSGASRRTGPSRRRDRRLREVLRRFRWLSLVAIVGAVLATSFVTADVVLVYQATTSAGGTASPFMFVDGGNYATASGLGFYVRTYPNAQQVSVATTVNGADGASATYLMDVLELRTTAATTVAWNLEIDVSTALVASGVNAAYISYCATAPTGVADTGLALSSGTDANGNPWAIYPPVCAGEVNEALTAVGPGAIVPVAAGTASGVSVLYISFLIAVTNTGAATTTPASLSLVATA